MGVKGLRKTISLNPFTPKSDLIDFTLSNARRFYSSERDPLGVEGLKSFNLTSNDHCLQEILMLKKFQVNATVVRYQVRSLLINGLVLCY